MRQPLTVAAATIALMLPVAACSDDRDSPPPPVDARPSQVGELVADGAAADEVAAALAALRDGGSGTFTTRVEYDDVGYDYHGSYRLSPAQQRISISADLPDGPLATEAVGAGGAYFVRLPADGPVSSPCWVVGDPAEVAEVTGVETDPDFRQLPGAIRLAVTVAGVAPAEGSAVDDVLGTVDLTTAMALVSPRLPGLLGITGEEHPVVARIALADGVLSSIRLDGTAILAALDEAGTEADVDELERVFGADVPIEVTLADSGADVVIEPPEPARVIDLGRPDAAQRLGSCG